MGQDFVCGQARSYMKILGGGKLLAIIGQKILRAAGAKIFQIPH